MNDKLSAVTSDHNNALQLIQSLQSSNLITKQSLEVVQKEKVNLEIDLRRVSEAKKSQEGVINSLESTITSLSHQIHELEVREREAIANDRKSVEKLELIQNQMKREESSVSVLKSQNNQLEGGIKAAGEEIKKVLQMLTRQMKSSENYNLILKVQNQN